MRLFGIELTATPAAPGHTSLFGGAPIGVAKADVPPGARIDTAGTERLQQTARVGSPLPAVGTRPDPGQLPSADEGPAIDLLRSQIRWGQNLAYTPRSGFGTPFSTLRQLTAASPELFTCIQCRKDQMASLDFDFAPRQRKDKSADLEAKVQRAREFFARPDRVTPFKTWIQTGVDEILTIDALSIYKRPTRKGAAKKLTTPGYHLAPDEIAGYEILDGSTFQVLVDERGMIPLPPNKAFRQIIYGVPIAGGDCTTDELLYIPKNVRTWSPYGMSPTEAVLLIVNAALNRTLYNLSYYVRGNIPEALVGAPQAWSPKQVRQFAEYWDLVLKGDPTNRAGLRFVPSEMAKNVHEFRRPDFTTVWELWLLKVICACFGVTPSEIGFTDDVNKATSKSQGDVNQRRGVKPMANFWKGILDAILADDLGLPELETIYSGGEGEDALSQARIVDLNLRNGRMQLDEVRAEDGQPALNLGPGLVTATGFVPFAGDAPAADTPGGDDPAPDDQPAPGGPAPRTGDDVAAQAVAQKAELRKYQTVALKAVKAGRPAPAFTTTLLPTRLHAVIAKALETTTTAEEVVALFAAARSRVEKAQRLSNKQIAAEKKATGKITSVLADMGAAFAAHAEKELASRSA